MVVRGGRGSGVIVQSIRVYSTYWKGPAGKRGDTKTLNLFEVSKWLTSRRGGEASGGHRF